MMKVWNMVLISATFFLCIFGTFLTRSGVVSSVHAFAQSPIGKYFVTFLAIGIAGTIYLILDRLDYLKSESHMESVISRESSFLFNNLILLASCFAVLWGTLFPVISEALTGDKISVDRPFFERVNVPIGLFLLFLTGVGPLIAWRRSSLESLKRAFLWPSLAGLVLVIGLVAAGMRHPYALLAFGLCMFVAWTIISEFYKGAHAISGKSGKNLFASAIELTHRNTRRYGGYVIHMGIVFMFIGFTGWAFRLDSTVEVQPGSVTNIGHYQLRIADLTQGENDNYVWNRAVIQVSKDGQPLGTLEPEKRLYKASKQPTSEVAIRRRLNEDLYLNYAGMSNDNTKAVIQTYVFPLVSWIWIGYWVLLIGTLVCLIPPKVRLQYARTQVVGIAGRHAIVEK
jgi:cytochrome c-type biogenesis protein CcmF